MTAVARREPALTRLACYDLESAESALSHATDAAPGILGSTAQVERRPPREIQAAREHCVALQLGDVSLSATACLVAAASDVVRAEPPSENPARNLINFIACVPRDNS
jgi:hypothetical protein